MKSESGLRYPFCSYAGMMIHPESRIQGELGVEVLTEVNIPGQFVFVFVYQLGSRPCLTATDIFVPCMASVTEPVESQSNAVPLKETGALVK